MPRTALAKLATAINKKTVLRTKSDVICLRYASEQGPIFVLQLGDIDQNVLVKEGGNLVFSLLELCDGCRRFDAVIIELKKKFDARETLWTVGLKEAIEALIAWKAIEIVE